MSFRKVSQTITLVVGCLFVAQSASAATQCKTPLSQKGMHYFSKAKAVSSAKGRWEKKAAIKHGIGFSFWNKAKGRSTFCGFKMKNGKKLWNCTLKAKPCKTVKLCKPKLAKAGMFYFDKAKAKSSAVGRWQKQAAINYGMGYSFWNSAKNKNYSCSFTMKNGKKLWNCKAIARPCK